MDSNKKHRTAGKEWNEERDRYYKRLRREQEKHGKKGLGTKKECDACTPRRDSVKQGDDRQN